ncbi:coilin isoform X1 [Musa acuminata AAA Group]|uniref:coilin isoform X1 n=1 Tax=Musa acuminata AAA Group TaxID=214697 RepID=UPI0031D4E217
MEDAVRLRVEFDDHRVLTKTQRLEGLCRCWLLLRPELSTVSDVATHLVRAFALHLSCPHGILLSMDEFVLPPFESSSIFRDKDIVRVKKKVAKTKQLLEICGDAYHIQDSKIVEKQPITSGNELLNIKDFHEDLELCKSKKGEDACEVEGNTTKRQILSSEETILKRKRKQSDKPQNSKKKIKLTSPTSKETIVTADQEENVHSEQQKSPTLDKTHILSNRNEKHEKLVSSQNAVQKRNCHVTTKERHDQVEDCHRIPSQQQLTDSMNKSPSRSARRKKAKRQWLREMANQQLSENKQGEKQANDVQGTLSKYKIVDQTIEIEEEIVPVIVRPGHIRFEPIDGDGEHGNTQSNGPVETLQWNGTTSKKKGQKWGRGKTLSKKSDDDYCNGAFNENMITEEGEHIDDHINFESLFPLTRLPEEGDILVYRLVELSSSWCPELSSFRVGKVSSYDSISMKIVLLPIPEYPISSQEKKDAEESAQEPDSTLYKEDGSLEIEYTSLVDVRLLKGHDSDNLQNEKSKEKAQSNNWDLALVDANPRHSAAPLVESRPTMGWDQIDQALSERKAQLQQTDSWAIKGSTTASWSYRALRGSALGPTLALLRGTNGSNANSPGKHASGKYPSSK